MASSCPTYPEFLLGDEDAGSLWADEGSTVYIRADLDPFEVFAEHFDEWAWPYGPGAPALVLMARDPFDSPAGFSRVGDPGATVHGDPHWSVEVDPADAPQDCAAYWRIDSAPIPAATQEPTS